MVSQMFHHFLSKKCNIQSIVVIIMFGVPQLFPTPFSIIYVVIVKHQQKRFKLHSFKNQATSFLFSKLLVKQK